MTKEQFEKLLGCPIEKLPIGRNPRISVIFDGHKGTFEVSRVLVYEWCVKPSIWFWHENEDGTLRDCRCFLKDYGLTWAASEEDWEFAKAYRERKNKEEGK